MIIRVSGRMDIPAFYADSFIKRMHAGYCVVPNPFYDRLIDCCGEPPTAGLGNRKQ